MDDDLKAYLDRNFQQFGQQIQQLREETAQQFRESRAETDRQFREARAETDRQFQEAREETDRQFRGLREETAQNFQEMGQRMDRIEASVRHARVLIEGLHEGSGATSQMLKADSELCTTWSLGFAAGSRVDASSLVRRP